MPDEEMLALWVEDELTGEFATSVNAWAAVQPEWLARREEAREIKALLRGNLPAAEEPPYADFFNSRISREIARESAAEVAAAPAKTAPGSFWRFFLPATSVVGMAFCFWAGTRLVPAQQGQAAPPLANIPAAMPVLYTPEQGVTAAYFNSSPAHAEVIVLNGVAAIPDSFEVPETAAVEEPVPATADIEHQQR